MRGLKPLLFLAPLALLVLPALTFELQDTIHALIEENIHLHDQLENLTNALKELKRMLWHHANGIKLCCMQLIQVSMRHKPETVMLQRFKQSDSFKNYLEFFTALLRNH